MPDPKLVTARHALGIAILGIVITLWVASSFLMRSIFGEGKSYDKPFLVTWINTGTFSLYLIPWAARTLLDHSRKSLRAMSISDSLPTSAARKTIANDDSRSGSLEPDQEGIELIRRSVRSPLLNQVEEHERSEQHRPPLLTEHSIRTFGSQDAVTADSDLEPLTTMETAKLGCVFSLIWFAANYFGNVSLSYTNVASFTIISSLSGFFTLAVGSLLGVEIFTMAKLLALCVSIIGVILVATQDTQGSSTRQFLTDLLIGDILALVGAALYGVYTVFLKYKVRNEERVSMPLFFGFVGIFNLLVLWPVIILLDVTGLEPFSLPSSQTTWTVVVLNASITFISDYLWVLAMLMTSPLVVTVGISMSIPLALLGDHILYSHSANVLFFLGAFLVFASFIAINISYKSDQQEQLDVRNTRREPSDSDVDRGHNDQLQRLFSPESISSGDEV